jgi:hypothetical protein
MPLCRNALGDGKIDHSVGLPVLFLGEVSRNVLSYAQFRQGSTRMSVHERNSRRELRVFPSRRVWQEENAMQDYLEVEAMFKTVTAELKEWKILMKDLAGAFYRRYPATKRAGWTLHLKRCARSKACDMCPHSLYWVRYTYRRLSGEKRAALVKAGKEAPKTMISWDNRPGGTSRDGLPKNLKLPHDDRVIYEKCEAIRMEIMRQHKALSALRVRFLARLRGSKTGYSITADYFADRVIRDYVTAMLPVKPIKIAVMRGIQELWTPR